MLKAKDIMQSSPITAKQDTPVIEAINILGQNKITGLPVVDDDMTLVGIITRKDIIAHAFVKLRKE